MSFILADAGKSSATIIISTDADRVVRFAAGELNSYMEKITGTGFKILKKKNCPSNGIFLCASDKCDSFPAAVFANKEVDAFVLLSFADGISIRGSNSRSILYGVYDFLETLGCVFLEPGKETIPKLEVLEVPYIERKSSAAFKLRNIFRIQIVKSRDDGFEGLDPEHHLPQIDWMAKQRLNHYVFYVDYYRYDLWEKHKHQILDALLDRGFKIEVTHHSIMYFCPPDENHDFGNYGSFTYQRNKPEWYASSGGEYQVRIELPEVREVIKDRYLEYLRNNPEVDIAGLWPGDSSVNHPYPELSHTDGYLKFWNEIGENLKKSFPEKSLATLAYFELTEAPTRITPNSNIHNWFCRHDDNYMYSIRDEKNRKYFDLLKEWTEKMPPEQIACFHYYGWMPVLTPFIENMQIDLMTYKEMELAGVYGWSGFTYNILGNNYRWARDLYVFSRLLWEPEQDLKILEKRWVEGVFGTSSREILHFYETLRKIHEFESGKGLLPRVPWISLDLLHSLQRILAKARKQADSPEILHRINLLEQITASGATAVIQRTPQTGIEKFF